MPTETRDPGAPLTGTARTLRIAVIALLALSSILTLAGLPELQRAVAGGRWPGAALWVPPVFLAAFVVVYGAYRFVLVRSGRYPAGKALVRVGLLTLVVAVVAGIVLDPGRAPVRAPVDLSRALRSRDPDVRAMAAELARHRPREVALPLAGALAELTEDPSPEVRRQAHASLVALAGSDVGGEGNGAAERWRAWRASEVP